MFSLRLILFGFVSAALLTAFPAPAHHGTRVAYDWTKSVRLTGVVTEFALRNPHSFLMFDVTDEDGNVVSWGAEMPPVGALRKIGVTRKSLRQGDRIEISLYPSRAGAPRGQHIVQEPLLINGVSSVAVGTAASPALTAVAPAKQPANTEFNPRDLSGVWFSLMRRSFTGEDGPIVIAEPPPMTAAGKAKYESQLPSFGPRAVPPGIGNDLWGLCNPPGVVRTLFFATPIEFIQTDDKLTQLFEVTRFWRTVTADGRALPESPDSSWFGTSSGRWEGNTFVIETTGFDDRLWLDSYAHPLSETARLLERWTRTDYATLNLELTLHDPVNYTMPVVSPLKVFKLQPKRKLQENLCAPIDEYTFNDKIRDPASGRGVIDAADWQGESGYEDGEQREAWESDIERMREEDRN